MKSAQRRKRAVDKKAEAYLHIRIALNCIKLLHRTMTEFHDGHWIKTMTELRALAVDMQRHLLVTGVI